MRAMFYTFCCAVVALITTRILNMFHRVPFLKSIVCLVSKIVITVHCLS